jgi:hypothetical protein
LGEMAASDTGGLTFGWACQQFHGIRLHTHRLGMASVGVVRTKGGIYFA